jgi:RNA polymerase sigma factor (sigma-70 family)
MKSQETRQASLGLHPGHGVDVTVNFWLKKRLQEISRCPPGFLLPVENKTPTCSTCRSPPWPHICITEQVSKGRSQVTYALEIGSSSGQNNEAAARKPLPVFRTLKKNVRSACSETSGCEARRLIQTQEETLRRGALEEMFVASRKRFLAIAYSILRNREDAEDAVQEAFLSAHRHLRSFEGRSELRTWLTRIVLNAALMVQRKRKLSAVRSSESGVFHDDGWTENIPDSQPDPEMIHAERETLQFMNKKLEKLRPLLRQAFTMTYYDDLSGAEASALLGVSLGTFKGRLFHARRKLLDRKERALVTPIRRTPGSSSESWKRKGLRRLQGLGS